MKYLNTYKIFESRFLEFSELISDLEDICQEFEDNNCVCKIHPENDNIIRNTHTNIISVKSRGLLGTINQPFYLEININTRILLLSKSGKIVNIDDRGKTHKFNENSFPDWFIENCRRIEDYMNSNGFRTLPNLKYPGDLENFDNVDELEDYPIFLGAKKLVLEFIPNETPKDI